MKYEAQQRMNAARVATWIVLVLLGSISSHAQLTVGDNLKMTMNGDLGYGFSTAFGNTINSTHANSLVGNGTINGSYYNPSFLSFAVHPFWDRTQNNATTAALTRDSGIDGSMSLFSGSAFPGSVSYTKGFASNAETGIIGGGTARTNGSSRTFAVTWSELLPDLPPVYASFSDTGASDTTLGSDGENHAHTRSLNLGSNYRLLGFQLNGTVNYQNWNTDYSDLVGFSDSSSGSSNGISVGASHPLPLHGSLGLGWGHNSYENHANTAGNGTTNTASVSTYFMPHWRVSVSGNLQYTTNLAASINRTLLSNGEYGYVETGSDSNALSNSGNVNVSIGHGWSAGGYVTRTQVHFSGREVVSTQYGGTANYNFQHGFLKMFRVSAGLNDIASKQGNTGLGMSGTIGMDHQFGRYDVSADYSYSQDLQTLYGIAATSRHSYGASVRRKVNDILTWGTTVRGSQSGLTTQVGSGSRTETLSGYLGFGRYHFGGSYSESRGTSILSYSDIPGLILQGATLNNSKTYSATVSTRLFKRWAVAGAYAQSHADMTKPNATSFNENRVYIGQVSCRMRKMNLSGEFSRTNQDATSIKNGPYLVNSIYFRLSRWFNVF